MKKLTIKQTIFILLFIVSIIGIVFTDINVFYKKQVSDEEFIAYMNNIGCQVLDSTDSQTDKRIIRYYKTINNCPYDIELIKYNNSLKFTNLKNKDVLNNANIVESKTNIYVSYYRIYTLGDYYKTSIEMDKSLLYMSGSSKYKEDLIKIQKDLGYGNNVLLKIYPINIFSIILLILIMIAWWKLNEKMNRKGYVCLIPIYNVLCLSEDIFGSKKYVILLFLPFVNILFVCKLGRVFNKKDNYILLMILFPYIFIPLISIDSSKYIKQ